MNYIFISISIYSSLKNANSAMKAKKNKINGTNIFFIITTNYNYISFYFYFWNLFIALAY
jgi:hypothetical protein